MSTLKAYWLMLMLCTHTAVAMCVCAQDAVYDHNADAAQDRTLLNL